MLRNIVPRESWSLEPRGAGSPSSSGPLRTQSLTVASIRRTHSSLPPRQLLCRSRTQAAGPLNLPEPVPAHSPIPQPFYSKERFLSTGLLPAGNGSLSPTSFPSPRQVLTGSSSSEYENFGVPHLQILIILLNPRNGSFYRGRE